MKTGFAFIAGLAAWLVLLPGFSTEAAEPRKVLFDFQDSTAPLRISTQDAKAIAVKSRNNVSLRVTTGHQQTWPGVTLPCPAGTWDLSTFAQVAMKVRNVGSNQLAVFCRVDNPGADGTKNCVSGSLNVKPGETGTLTVPLKRTSPGKLAGKLFGMRGYPVAYGGDGTINAGKVTQLLVFVSKPKEDCIFEVDEVRAEGRYVPPTASISDADPFFPFIDTFGQYRHKDWPAKVHSLAELQQRRETESQQLKAKSGPQDWDQYGGWKTGPQLKATGFFRTEKHQGKWWLVDPEGHLFLSHGIDCVRMAELTPIDQRAEWFEEFPGNKPEFAPFLTTGYTLKGHYAGQRPKCFSFGNANLLRKYGPDWKREAGEIAHRRLRSWGLNTIANWSDETIRLMRKTPYVDSIGSRGAKMIEGSEGYWGKFPDVFDPAFENGLRQSMNGRVGKTAGDPWCLGYFCDNEIAWGDEVSLAMGALRSPPEQAAKVAFLADLKQKYGQIEKLNAAWGTQHASWDALLQDRSAPDRKKAHDDLTAFYTRIAEQYFKTARDVIKEKAPQQLFLGCRFAWVNQRAAAVAAKHCDVVSYNLYQRSVAAFQFNGGADVPLIIGEFHFGALDRGMFHTGLVSMNDQVERAATYKDYVQGVLRHPNFVGCHWFQYQDQPTIGRVLDEENYQIGFVDIADTPYPETIQACREVGYDMYRYRLSN